MSEQRHDPYAGWAIVELFGHRRLAGRVAQVEQYGQAMLRLDVPSLDGTESTHFYGGGAVYGVHPTTEEIVRHVAVTKPDRLAHGIETQVVDLCFEPSRELRGTRVGRLVGWKEDAGPTVDYPGNRRGPLVARTALALDPQSARAAAAQGRDVLLTFDSESSERLIIVALLEPELGQSRKPASPGYEAMVDGRRVVLDAQDEIVLRCGESSITLRRNGRVIISGAYVETYSRGVNRIKGGSVQVDGSA